MVWTCSPPLLRIIQRCLPLGRLQQAIKKPASHIMPANEAKALSILIFIVSLLAEHCNFDRLKIDVPGMSVTY
jgi:hypothetical protein